MSTTKRDAYAVGTAGWGEGTNANTIRTTLACPFVIDGRAFNLAAADNLTFAAFPGTSFTPLAARQVSAFFFMVNAAGTIHTLQAGPVASPGAAGYVPGAFEWPERDGYACLGALLVQTNGAATFTPNVTDLGAADVIDTFFNPGPDYSRPIPY